LANDGNDDQGSRHEECVAPQSPARTEGSLETWKWRRKALERLNSRPEIAGGRRPRPRHGAEAAKVAESYTQAIENMES